MAKATKLLQRAERTLERLSLAYSFWPMIPAGAVGIATGWAARGTATIERFGTVGWLAAGILGFLLTSLSFLALALAKEKTVLVKAVANWKRPTDAADPMADDYSRKRIAINDIAHPVTKRIVAKTFSQCELIGPANIIFAGRGTNSHVSFADCDIVVVKDHVYVKNIVVFEDCNLVGGTLWQCTVFMAESLFTRLRDEVPAFESITHLAPPVRPAE